MSGRIVESFQVEDTLEAYRIVSPVTGTAQTVQYPVTAGCLPAGVTIDNVKDTTSAIPVCISGKAKLYFNDTVTSGQLVESDTSGRGVPFSYAYTSTAFTLLTGVIGLLVDATIANTGTIAEVLVAPQMIRNT